MFGILRGNFESVLCAFCRNVDLKIWPFLPDFDLTFVKSKLSWRHRVKWPSASISSVKWPRKHVSHVTFVTCAHVTFVTCVAMTFVLTQYPSQTFTSTLCKLEVFAAHRTDITAQNVKTAFFYLWPNLGLTRYHYLKMLNMLSNAASCISLRHLISGIIWGETPPPPKVNGVRLRPNSMPGYMADPGWEGERGGNEHKLCKVK